MADQPSLDTIPTSFTGLQTAFRPERAGGVNKTIQFHFTGDEPGDWNLTIRDGALTYAQGTADSPNTTVTVASQDWLAILRGTLNPMTAVLGGKLKIAGDMALMMQFQTWFDRNATA